MRTGRRRPRPRCRGWSMATPSGCGPARAHRWKLRWASSTPETVDPDRPVGCYGPEASAYTKHLLTGRRVPLVYDRELYDRKYGRWLAYIYLERPGRPDLFVNARLVRPGTRGRCRFRPTRPTPRTCRARAGGGADRPRAVDSVWLRAVRPSDGRLIGIAVIAAAAAVVARLLTNRAAPVAASGNGHTADEERVEMLRERDRSRASQASRRVRQRSWQRLEARSRHCLRAAGCWQVGPFEAQWLERQELRVPVDGAAAGTGGVQRSSTCPTSTPARRR